MTVQHIEITLLGKLSVLGEDVCPYFQDLLLTLDFNRIKHFRNLCSFEQHKYLKMIYVASLENLLNNKPSLAFKQFIQEYGKDLEILF